jgi:PAS domain S-box-containing protein
MEAELRESRARKAAVMEAALDAIVLMDHGGHITSFNPAAERMFGYSRAEAIGRPLAEVMIPEALRAQHQAGLERYLQGGDAKVLGRHVELPARRRDGSEFPAEIAVVRIQTDGPALFTGYIRDITERNLAAEAKILRREKDAAEEANAELDSFSYSVAHDLRAPLRAINGFATALTEEYGGRLDEQARHYLSRITVGADRMAELIDALLSLARLTRADARKEPVELTALARNIVEQLRALDPKRDVEVLLPAPLVVKGDQALLHQLLQNLLGNAWKFTAKTPGPRIELGRDGATYFVRDNGAGFDMAHVGKLFAPFRRLHAPADFEGTGIGLATVQRIVRRHGGRVWAEARENAGATFYFTLGAAS